MGAPLARLTRTACAAVGVLLPLGGLAIFARLLHERLLLSDSFMRVVALMALGLLVLMSARYCIVLWFAFLEHLETASDDTVGREPFVTIVVPVYNEERVIDDSIRSLAAIRYPRYEIVVVDDGSSDATYREALAEAERQGGATVRVVTQPNAGKAQALNRGIEAAAGDFVLCVDGDSILDPGTLRAAMRHFRDPHVGAVAGNVKVANRVNLLTWMQALEYVEGLNLLRRAQGFFHAVNIVPGPLGVFRKAAIRSVGGYPSGTFAEDCDLTLALLAAGWRIVYEPRALALTEAPLTTGALCRQRYRWTRGLLQVLRKRLPLVVARRTPFAARFTVFYMLGDTLLWPPLNILVQVFLLVAAAYYGVTQLFVLWWLQLSLLDTVSAWFSIATEGEDPRLVPLALAYRATYTLLLDFWKLTATVEELLGLSMTWGKLDRVGLAPRR